MRGIFKFGILSLIFAVCENGCIHSDDTRTAGVDDFPNSIQARVNDFLADSKKSEEITTGASAVDGIGSQGGFQIGAAKSGAAKIAGAKIAATQAVCTATLKYDTTFILNNATTVNHLTFCLDSAWINPAIKNKTILEGSVTTTYSDGRKESTFIYDGDGDGILNAIPGKNSKANVIFTKTFKGIVEKTTTLVGPGSDNNFDTEADNLIFKMNWSKIDTILNDTLAYAQYSEADSSSDGILIDNSNPSLVDLELYQKGPDKDHADGLWTKLKTRLLVKYKVEPKETRRIHYEVHTKNLHKHIADILNLKSEPDIQFSDTLLVRFSEVSSNPNDTLDSASTLLKMDLGKDLENKLDDKVFTLSSKIFKKLGEEKSASFDFISNDPIPSGQKPTSGILTMKIGYTDLSTLEVNGSLSNDGLDVTIKNRNGQKQHVVWDALGRGVKAEPVP